MERVNFALKEGMIMVRQQKRKERLAALGEEVNSSSSSSSSSSEDMRDKENKDKESEEENIA